MTVEDPTVVGNLKQGRPCHGRLLSNFGGKVESCGGFRKKDKEKVWAGLTDCAPCR